ncbi:hypothetical protein ABZP36_033934 [Zizania latifolia]
MGMLSTAAYVLTMDMFGPIADNAGGIVEMSQQPESVREITDILDAVGNTMKATTKGFAIGSAALASFLLFSAYMDEVASLAQLPFKEVDIAIPEVFVGGLLGSMLIFLFSAWACSAVGKTAQEVVNEVRRQFIESPGIMNYKEKPDYGRCVAIVASASLREMIKPGALAIISPMAAGIIFRILGHAIGQALLGAKVVAAMLMFATVAGILMALFLNTAGGAWDNAKKYIETGALGGKGSEYHKAAVTGDTSIDPMAAPAEAVSVGVAATKVGPAAMAYIRRVVAALADKSFDEACDHLISDNDQTTDLFADRPEPTFLPSAVALAMNTLEELLRRGSSTLAAYEREAIRYMSVLQKEKATDAMENLRFVEDVTARLDATLAERAARILAVRATMGEIHSELAAVIARLADGEAGWAEVAFSVRSLVRRLAQAEESEADLLTTVARMTPAFVYFLRRRELSRARADAEMAALEAIPDPDMPGHLEDVDLLCDAEESYEKSIGVLTEFTAKLP